MGLELVLTDAQIALIANKEISNRGYVFVQEKGDQLIATKIVLPSKKATELILLSELEDIDKSLSPDEQGYIPYIHGDSKNHGRCAYEWYYMNRKISNNAAELRLSSFVNKIMGYGVIGEKPVFRRFVSHSWGVSAPELAITVCKEDKE